MKICNVCGREIGKHSHVVSHEKVFCHDCYFKRLEDIDNANDN